MAFELFLRLVLELLDCLPAETQVDYQVGLPVEHEGYHNDTVFLCIWELQGVFGCFDIVCQHPEVGSRENVIPRFQIVYQSIVDVHLEPLAGTQSQVNTDSGMEGDVVLSD